MAYERQYYTNGDVLNAEQLNHMEAGIKENSDNIDKLSEDIADLKENGTGGGTVVSSVEPETDDIPKVFFSEAIPQTKDDATTAFRYISKTEDISGYAEFKAQGNSSMSYPKKNMTVKMYSDEALSEKLKVDFKEWGKQAKHVYKANWIDLTHARNIVSARLWADVVKSRENYLELPELLRTSPNQGAVDGFPVKVYSKGIYQGRYTLNIPKDAWMANMDDALDNHCILCGENYASGCFRATANIDGNDWSDEVHETVPQSIKTRWNEVISFVMNSTDEDFKTNLGEYFFVDSLIDYFIFGMVSCGLDAFGKNQLYMTYDGVKWIASMYDMDSTWGLYYNGSKIVSATYKRTEYEDYASNSPTCSGEGNLLYNRLEKVFYEEIQARYEELKNGALSVPNIINRFERFTDIASLDLVKEDYASTTGGGKFTGIPSKSTNNIQQIRQFIIDRYSYCDEYMENLAPAERVPATEITLDKKTLTFTNKTPQTITATVEPSNTTDMVVWNSSDKSVAVVNNGIVTPISKGSCTITASCGSVVATCEVVVEIEIPEWDYEWTADSGESPVTYNGITADGEFVDGLYKLNSDYDFADVGSIEVEIVFRTDSDSDTYSGKQSPQFSLCHSSGNGFKVFYNTEKNISTSIGGSNADTGVKYIVSEELQTFRGIASPNGCSFELGNLSMNGDGVVNNTWMTATRIAVNSVDFHLAELRYKYL